jgi:hypothetical protein
MRWGEERGWRFCRKCVIGFLLMLRSYAWSNSIAQIHRLKIIVFLRRRDGLGDLQVRNEYRVLIKTFEWLT